MQRHLWYFARSLTKFVKTLIIAVGSVQSLLKSIPHLDGPYWRVRGSCSHCAEWDTIGRFIKSRPSASFSFCRKGIAAGELIISVILSFESNIELLTRVIPPIFFIFHVNHLYVWPPFKFLSSPHSQLGKIQSFEGLLVAVADSLSIIIGRCQLYENCEIHLYSLHNPLL